MFLIIGVWGGPRRVYAELQVLPLHVPRLGADAARHHGDVLGRRHHRHPDRCCTTLSRARCRPGRGSPSSPPSRSKCRCGRSIPGCPTPMSRRRRPARSSSPAILLKMGGYGFLRFSLPMFPLASQDFAPLIFALVGRRDHLHLAGGAGAGGHEEADRLFLGRPYGLRHHGHLRRDHAGRRRRHLPDALARHRLGRAVPVRRRRL